MKNLINNIKIMYVYVFVLMFAASIQYEYRNIIIIEYH